MSVDLAGIGGSALTDPAFPCRNPAPGIPVTYVPARNTLFLSLALGWAEVIGADDIFVGVNAVDYSGYPDCRPQFIEFEQLAQVATKAGIEGTRFKIQAPLIDMSKAEIIHRASARRGLARRYRATRRALKAGVRPVRFLPVTRGRVCERRCRTRHVTLGGHRGRNWGLEAAPVEILSGKFGYDARLHGTVAQLVEQGPFKALVLGSSPSRPTIDLRIKSKNL